MANITGSIADAGRLIHLAKRRERHLEDVAKQKKKLEEEVAGVSNIGAKFSAHYDAIEQTLKSSTVGLVTLHEMRQKQEDVVKKRELQLAHKMLDSELKQETREEEAKRLKKLAEEQKRRVLSFDPEDDVDDEDDDTSADAGDVTNPVNIHEEDDDVPAFKKKKIGKDPSVDTSFLPDKNREEEENRLREELRQKWTEDQERIKNEEINIAFAYWDGSGHRRDFKMKKGATIGQFLQKALELLRKDFHELKTCTSDSLMFIKEDLIVPHFYSFYDFIVTKAMGKTGPLFEFDAQPELRVRMDAAMNKTESHPAKVVLRSWYEKNKHIYPSSRWEPFMPSKRYSVNENADENSLI